LKHRAKFGALPTAELLPDGYEKRDEQLQLAEECRDSLVRGESYVAHAPCGLGKSLATLMAAKPLIGGASPGTDHLPPSGTGDKRLFVTYRTRSQLDIYLKEVEKLEPSLVAASTISKRDMCPRLEEGYSDFQKSCTRLKKNTRQGEDPYCPEYEAVLDDPAGCREEALAACKEFQTPIQFSREAAEAGICPYESMKLVMPEADVFLGTYHYLFEPAIRGQLLNSLEADMADLVVVCDEAHNVPEFARSLLSTRHTGRSLARAINEAEKFNQEDALDVLRSLDRHYTHLRKTLGSSEMRSTDPGEIDAELSVDTDSAAKILEESGEFVWRRRFEEDGRGFSSIGRTGQSLSSFCGKTSPKYAHWAYVNDFAGSNRDSATLELSNLDGRELTDPVVNRSYASVFMSGTLTPAEVYRDLLTSQETVTRQHPSPFPRQNREVIVARDVSSKMKERTDEGLDRMATHVQAVADRNRGNVAVFATSYSMMNRLKKKVNTSREVLTEKRGDPVKPVLNELRSTDDALLFAVMGGKLSEGVDYEGNLLTGVIAAGFPYPPWSEKRKALIEYMDEKFEGHGRLYGYLVPAITRLLQTTGRVHRSVQDRGPIVVLDRRVTHRYVAKHLPRELAEDIETVDSPRGTALAVKRFWERSN